MFNFKPTTDSTVSIDFDLSNHLRVDKILYHNEPISFKHKQNKLVIALPDKLIKGVIDSVEIEYHGKPIASGFGSLGVDKKCHLAWTLSQPYGARDWWPCRQNLLDKIDSMDIYVTCPTKYKVATNGRLIGYTDDGDQHTAHYDLRHPANYYTVDIAVGLYDIAEAAATLSDGSKIELIDYYSPMMDYNVKKQKHVANFINFFSDYWIHYPFADEKYGQVMISSKVSFETQTMSFLSQTDIGTMAHELAHQWFGNYVTCGGWKNLWINEAFATFGELLILEKYYSDLSIEWKKYTINNALSSKRAIFNVDTLNPELLFDVSTIYNKSAMTLLMLRNEIGAEAFQKGCRLILEKYANGFATIADAQQCFETAADTSLTDFFKNWIYGIGHPIYTIKYERAAPGKTTINIKQTTSHSSVKFYPMHVTVRLEGKDDYKDVQLYHINPIQDFVVDTDFEVENVIFDPECDILCKWNVVGQKAKKER